MQAGIGLENLFERLKELGMKHSQEEIHQWLKSQFLFEEKMNTNTGEVFKIPLSLGDMGKVGTVRMMEYFDDIYQFASESLDLMIPEPIQAGYDFDNENLQI